MPKNNRFSVRRVMTRLRWYGLLSTLVVCTAQATTEPRGPLIAPVPGVTMGQLERLQSKNLLLAARVQNAQLEKQLADAGREPASGVVMDTRAVGLPGGMDMTASPSTSSRATPALNRVAVREVSGRGNQLQATLALSNGGQVVVKVGHALPGTGLTIKAISLSSVTLSDGSQLTF